MRRLVLTGLAVGSLAVVAACTPIKPPTPEPDVVEVPFEFTGVPEEWQVPAGVEEITVTAYGAAGGHGFGSASTNVGPGTETDSGTGGTGGLGGSAVATLPVSPGETLQVTVGGRGGDGTAGSAGASGANGGAPGGFFPSPCTGPDVEAETIVAGGGGGGASDVRDGAFGLANRLVVAGGGGGGGSPYALAVVSGFPSVADGGGGGGGGGLAGASGIGVVPGGGGTQSGGGVGGVVGLDGSAGNGGVALGDSDCAPTQFAAGRVGGGGGGGHFGGGGGYAVPLPPTLPGPEVAGGGGGGGGGSGFGPAGTEFQTGVREGNGRVVISYVAP